MRKTIFLLFILFCYLFANAQEYAVSTNYTPVLNTSDFQSVFGGKSGNRVKTDNKGLIREMEFIAFPNTVFEILDSYNFSDHIIYKVKTNDYQYNNDLYIDNRFVKIETSKPQDRIPEKISKENIIENLKKLIGYPYMWGGNYAFGIYELLNYYPPKVEIDENTESLWVLKGVDCSGLIYQSTNGLTPRNTSSMSTFGNAVDIEGKNANQIAELLEPLDLMVIKGHVVIVLDKNTAIESSPKTGVHTTDLRTRLKKLLKEYSPANDFSNGKFVVRRWIN